LDSSVIAADQFKDLGRVVDVRSYGQGHIHETYLATLDGGFKKNFILQRLNLHVFPQPSLILQNLRSVTEHALAHQRRLSLFPGGRWELPFLLPARDGRDYWVDGQGSFWRALHFIDKACSFETILDLNHAREVGQALGFFHRLIYDLPLDKLVDTLPGFHITPSHLEIFDQVLTAHPPPDSPEVDFCRHFIDRRRSKADTLEKAKAEGRLSLRPIHGDPKVNNVLMDTTTRRAVSLIDLDTVKPGLIHYDIGDCLRSCGNRLGEDPVDRGKVYFDPAVGQAILQGYLAMTGEFLDEEDHHYVYEALRLIAFELGVRFFTDYLAGNIYFKVKYKNQNLNRSLVQFKLTESIEAQADAIRALINDLQWKK
jgi:hypothetical protein